MSDTMKRLDYDIILDSPLLISSTAGDENMIGTEDYITGAALLGAFAKMWIDDFKAVKNKELSENEDEYQEFFHMFLSGDLMFLNGYPVKNGTMLQPVPLSIQYKKGHNEDAMDLMFADKKERKHNGGFCRLYHKDETLCFEKHSVDKQYQMHHERTNQKAGRSADGEIYNYESITPRQLFCSAVIGKDTDVQIFQQKIGVGVKRIRLGRSKTTQYGGATIAFSSIKAFEEIATTKDEKEISKKTLSLTFLSDVIILNDVGETEVKKDILEKTLQKELGDNELRIEKSFMRAKTVESYVSVWKARRPSQAAFEKGSCFQVSFGKTTDKIKEKIKELEFKGLGLRRNEGYGRVVFNWQSGQITDVTEKQKKKNQNELLANPPNIAPKAVQTIFQDIVTNWLVELARSVAANRAISFAESRKKPTATQLHKLRHFALYAENYNKFKTLLEAMKNNTSTDKLKEIKDKKDTLWEFIKKDHFARIGEIELDSLSCKPDDKFEMNMYDQIRKGFPENKSTGKKQFLKYAGFESLVKKEEIKALLFREFYDTFFSLLDKRIKTEEKEKGKIGGEQ